MEVLHESALPVLCKMGLDASGARPGFSGKGGLGTDEQRKTQIELLFCRKGRKERKDEWVSAPVGAEQCSQAHRRLCA